MKNCKFNGCHRPSRSGGYCNAHYARNRRWGNPAGLQMMRDAIPATCAFESCPKKPDGRGFCGTHYERLRIHGTLHVKERRKPGSGCINSDGYVVFQRIVNGKRIRIKEHRLVMEQMLGRPLLPNETPHHKNGNKADNRPDNLELWVTHQPHGHRVSDCIDDALRTLRLYAPHLLDATYRQEAA